MSKTRQWWTSTACYESHGSGGSCTHNLEGHSIKEPGGFVVKVWVVNKKKQNSVNIKKQQTIKANNRNKWRFQVSLSVCTKSDSKRIYLHINTWLFGVVYFYDVCLNVNKYLSWRTTIRRNGNFMPHALPHRGTSPLAAPWRATRRS